MQTPDLTRERADAVYLNLLEDVYDPDDVALPDSPILRPRRVILSPSPSPSPPISLPKDSPCPPPLNPKGRPKLSQVDDVFISFMAGGLRPSPDEEHLAERCTSSRLPRRASTSANAQAPGLEDIPEMVFESSDASEATVQPRKRPHEILRSLDDSEEQHHDKRAKRAASYTGLDIDRDANPLLSKYLSKLRDVDIWEELIMTTLKKGFGWNLRRNLVYIMIRLCPKRVKSGSKTTRKGASETKRGDGQGCRAIEEAIPRAEPSGRRQNSGYYGK